MAPSRMMGTGVLQWPSDEAANPRGAKVPTCESPVRGDPSTLCKERRPVVIRHG